MRNFLAGVIRTQNPEQTRPQPPVERGWADKADSRPVGWGTGARTLGSGGNSTHFKVGLSPAPMATFPAAPPKMSVTVREGTTFSVRRVPARNQWVSADWCRPLVSHVFSQELT